MVIISATIKNLLLAYSLVISSVLCNRLRQIWLHVAQLNVFCFSLNQCNSLQCKPCTLLVRNWLYKTSHYTG